LREPQSTAPASDGSGLGPPVAYDIVTKQHGGTIAVDREAGDHTASRIGLPRAMSAVEGAAA